MAAFVQLFFCVFCVKKSRGGIPDSQTNQIAKNDCLFYSASILALGQRSGCNDVAFRILHLDHGLVVVPNALGSRGVGVYVLGLDHSGFTVV